MSVIHETSLPAFFKSLVEQALARQQLAIHEVTAVYLVNLLKDFARSEELFSQESSSVAELFLNSLQDIPTEKREQHLKRVGDVTLYLSGFFSDSLNRKIFDIDYYMKMGGLAYGSLANMARDSLFANLYGELSHKFYPLVDLFSAISEEKSLTRNEDILRLYERWLKTGSPRLQQLLIDQGLLPVESSSSKQ